MIELFLLAFTGAVAGIVHVLIGPDHLAAVAPFTANRNLKTWLTGLLWGIGHTSGVWITGILLYFMHDWLPLEEISHWSERLVGIVLIGLGFWGIRKAMTSHVHYHTHEHDGSRHAHFHVHDANNAHSPRQEGPHEHKHGLMGIGLLHGLAGSSHLIGILPALAIPSKPGIVMYVGGFGIGAILAMTVFSWLLGNLSQKLLAWSANAFRYLQYGFSAIAIVVGLVWLAFI